VHLYAVCTILLECGCVNQGQVGAAFDGGVEPRGKRSTPASNPRRDVRRGRRTRGSVRRWRRTSGETFDAGVQLRARPSTRASNPGQHSTVASNLGGNVRRRRPTPGETFDAGVELRTASHLTSQTTKREETPRRRGRGVYCCRLGRPGTGSRGSRYFTRALSKAFWTAAFQWLELPVAWATVSTSSMPSGPAATKRSDMTSRASAACGHG